MTEIVLEQVPEPIAQDVITDEPRQRLRSRLALAAGGALLASSISGCYAFTDTVSSEEALVQLDGKQNTCYGIDDDISPRCGRPTLALLYPKTSDIDPQPYKAVLEQSFDVVAPKGKKLSVKIIPITGQAADTMADDDCIPDSSYVYEAGELPTIQAAIEHKATTNKFDFVMGLSTAPSCDEDLMGVAIKDVGDRFMHIYGVPEEGEKNYDKKLRRALGTTVHEMGHGVLGLEHARGEYVGLLDYAEYSDSPTIPGTSLIDLDALIEERKQAFEYGDDNSIMGSKNLPRDARHLKPWQLLTPMELQDVSFDNNVDVAFPDNEYGAYGSVVLDPRKRNQYAVFRNERKHKFTYKGGYKVTEDYRDLMVLVKQSKDGPEVHLYAEAYNPDDGERYLTNLGYFSDFYDGPQQLVFRNKNGTAKLLTIAEQQDTFNITVEKFNGSIK